LLAIYHQRLASSTTLTKTSKVSLSSSTIKVSPISENNMAKKITMDSVHAFLAGKEFHRENMAVNTNGDVTYLRLHGNTIATRTKDGRVYIDSCGWFTNTTKERLNYLLQLLNGNYKITQKNWLWYINNNQWNGDKILVQGL
jgi:hypothetical protein